jgi:hypothetical protein
MTYLNWFVGVLLLIPAQIMGHVLKNKSFEQNTLGFIAGAKISSRQTTFRSK